MSLDRNDINFVGSQLPLSVVIFTKSVKISKLSSAAIAKWVCINETHFFVCEVR